MRHEPDGNMFGSRDGPAAHLGPGGEILRGNFLLRDTMVGCVAGASFAGVALLDHLISSAPRRFRRSIALAVLRLTTKAKLIRRLHWQVSRALASRMRST